MYEFPRLDSALDALYRAFGTAPELRAEDPERTETFMANVLRFEAIEEHRDILPEALEILGRDVGDSAGRAWLIMNKVAVSWRDWPESERRAIEVFMRAWWRAALSEYPRGLDIFELLDIMGTMGVDARACLSYWESRIDEPAIRHLAWLVRDFTVHSASAQEWYEVVDRWIGGAAPRRMLEAALSAEPGSPAIQEISTALGIWEAWARDEG